MREHLALCRRIDTSGWLTLAKQQEDWNVTSTTGQTVGPMIDASLDKLAQHPGADFTFSTCNAKALISNVVEVQPSAEAFSRLLPGRSITVLAPVGTLGHEDHWVHVWRDPRGNLSYSGRFVERILVEEVRKWAEFYGALKIERGMAGELDLYVRRDWSAAAFFDEAEFPPPKPIPTKSPEQKSKAEHDEEVRRIVRQNRSQLASKGYRWNQATKSWRPPAGE